MVPIHSVWDSACTRNRALLILGLLFALVGLLTLALPSTAQACHRASHQGTSSLVAPLPPRVTAVPQPAIPSSAPSATAIQLLVKVDDPKLASAGLWAEVEWQDGTGVWHAVEGWQGPLTGTADAQGEAAWYLGAGELGVGPFRWSLYDGQGGALLATSSPFSLPKSEGTTVTVEMQLSPQPLLPRSGVVAQALLAGGLSLTVGAALVSALRAGFGSRRLI